ncbi:MAG TPA: hypothetical protein VIX37_14425, partial [Candidatus Sulfotelmatobacter sp.]
IATQLVPIVLRFQTVATAINFKTGIFSTASGSATSDPRVPDTACFSGRANVPLKVMAQSPVLNAADFNFGGTEVGTTQYGDAFQRSNFWSLIDRKNYHADWGAGPRFTAGRHYRPCSQRLVDSRQSFRARFLDVARKELSISLFFEESVVTALDSLAGVNPGTLPLFMVYNTGMSFGDPTNLGNCCAGGFHSIVPVGPVMFQTYAPFDFDVSGLFLPTFNDTATASHEVAEWMNDPYIINDTPPWGHVGQVAGCQGNLEVGDPLSGNLAPRIFMPNGYTYDLQELVFFSWFFGAPPLGLHGWYSNNGTFLTDAGAPCK